MMRQSIGTILQRQGENEAALARTLECKRALRDCQAAWDAYEVASQKAHAAHEAAEYMTGPVAQLHYAADAAYERWMRAAERHRRIAGRCPPKPNGRRR